LGLKIKPVLEGYKRKGKRKRKRRKNNSLSNQSVVRKRECTASNRLESRVIGFTICLSVNLYMLFDGYGCAITTFIVPKSLGN